MVLAGIGKQTGLYQLRRNRTRPEPLREAGDTINLWATKLKAQ